MVILCSLIVVLPNSYSLFLQILRDHASFSFTVNDDDEVEVDQFDVLVITPDAFWSSLNALEQAVSGTAN